MFSKFIHVVGGITTLFFYMAKYSSIAWIYHFVYQIINGLTYVLFFCLAFMKKGAINIWVRRLVWTYVLNCLGSILGSEIAGSHGN